MTERKHDPEEDRANDKKEHDNPSHEGRHSYETHIQETEDQIKNWKKDKD